LDFFGGSGTTAHATLNLNRSDSGRRKFFLVEMGEYFDRVTLPRVKKSVYCNEWKKGVPSSSDHLSALVPYVRLETYEDAINNLALKSAPEVLPAGDSVAQID
ncbi:hypothetical protein O4J55_29805, partial [Paracoccus sp. PXZ]